VFLEEFGIVLLVVAYGKNEKADLTAAERKAVRDRYQTLQKLPPKQRQEVTSEWERYQKSLAQQQRKQGERPADHEEDQPEQKLHHT
jgi:hypothetical protein